MVEILVSKTEFELGVPTEKLAKQKRIEALEKTLKEAKEKKAKLFEEREEIKKAIGKEEKAQKERIETKGKKKARLLKKIGELTKIKPKKLDIDGAGRARLLKALIDKKKRPVSILRPVDDKIPSVFINGREQEQRKQLSFLGRGRLI